MRRNPAGFVDSAENGPSRDRCFCCPDLQGIAHPIRNRDGSNVAALADQISKYPMLLALLEILHGNSGEFSSAQSASKKYGDDGVISFVSETFRSACRE